MNDTAAINFERGPASYVASVLQYASLNDLLTADAFLRHFPAKTIMSALGDRPKLRAKILETVINPKITEGKLPEWAAETLQGALDEGIITPEAVLARFDVMDRVRCLPLPALWSYVSENPSWETREGGKEFIVLLIQWGLGNELLTELDVYNGVGGAPALVEPITLTMLWNQVIVPCIAERHGFVSPKA